MQPTGLPHGIAVKLARFERRRKQAAAARGLGEFLLALGAGVGVVMVLEWALNPRAGARFSLSITADLVAAFVLMGRVLIPLVRRVPTNRMAADLEQAAHGHFKDRIVSAVEMAESRTAMPLPGVSPWMVQRTIDLASEDLSAIDPAALVDFKPARKALRLGAGLLIVFSSACLVPGFRTRACLALNPRASNGAFSTTRLVVEPGDCRLRTGDSIEIHVTAKPVVDEAKLHIDWADGFQETVVLSRGAANGFATRLSSLSQGFHYLVRAGDGETPTYSVRVDEMPRIAGLQLRIQPPAYTGWTNRQIEGGSADFLEGSRVRLALGITGQTVTGVDYVAEGFAAQPLSLQEDHWGLDLQPTQTMSYQFRLTGLDQPPFAPAEKWTLRPLPDEPPQARLGAPGTESGLVQRDELLPLDAGASDDVGLKRVQLVIVRHESEAELKTLFPAPNTGSGGGRASQSEFHASINYSLAGLGLLTGDEVRFQLIATDLKDQTTRSEVLSVTIGSFDKALEARLAERLQVMVSGLDGQLEYLRQTRTSWLSMSLNYGDGVYAQGPALALLRTRLAEFAREMGLAGQCLVHESETNLVEEARLMYRLGTTLSTWGRQQDRVLLSQCGRLNQARGVQVAEVFDEGRDLFSRAVMDLEEYRRVVALLQGSFETDVLQTRCEGAQGRYRRGLAVLGGASNIVAPLGSTGSGLLAAFLDSTNLQVVTLEKKIDYPRLDLDDPVLNAAVKDSFRDRLKTSLSLLASVPNSLIPLTNIVNNDTLIRHVAEKLPVAKALAESLANLPLWSASESQQAQVRADDLAALAKDAHRLVREELDRFRWRYEGSAALKEVQNAVQDLRAVDQDIRHLPWHASRKLTDQELAKVTVARAWETELARAASAAARQLFEIAKQRQATLAERIFALTAASKARRELQPAIARLAKTLAQKLDKDDMLDQLDRRLNEVSDRYRELNELQERINHEQVANLARQALPASRAFARSQTNSDSEDLSVKFDSMHGAVAPVVEAQRVVGDYTGAARLAGLAGHSPQEAKGRETAAELRDLAQRTDQNPPSLALTIPPPMQDEILALDKNETTPELAAERLAQPRLAMALESERLRRQHDPKIAVAYEFLGEDTGALIDAPARLSGPTLEPLAARAAALAGQKGEDARQAEVASAMERLKQLALQNPADPSILARRLEDLSDLADQAAADAAKRAPLSEDLGDMSRLAAPVADWPDSTNPPEIAASAAHESLGAIQAAPKQGETYHDAARMLTDAARQLRMELAVRELTDLNPYAPPGQVMDDLDESARASAVENAGKLEGPAGMVSGLRSPHGLDQAEWARLNARLRQALQSSGIEHFTAEQQAAIRSYFERLSSDNDKPGPRN